MPRLYMLSILGLLGMCLFHLSHQPLKWRGNIIQDVINQNKLPNIYILIDVKDLGSQNSHERAASTGGNGVGQVASII